MFLLFLLLLARLLESELDLDGGAVGPAVWSISSHRSRCAVGPAIRTGVGADVGTAVGDEVCPAVGSGAGEDCWFMPLELECWSNGRQFKRRCCCWLGYWSFR